MPLRIQYQGVLFLSVLSALFTEVQAQEKSVTPAPTSTRSLLPPPPSPTTHSPYSNSDPININGDFNTSSFKNIHRGLIIAIALVCTTFTLVVLGYVSWLCWQRGGWRGRRWNTEWEIDSSDGLEAEEKERDPKIVDEEKGSFQTRSNATATPSKAPPNDPNLLAPIPRRPPNAYLAPPVSSTAASSPSSSPPPSPSPIPPTARKHRRKTGAAKDKVRPGRSPLSISSISSLELQHNSDEDRDYERKIEEFESILESTLEASWESSSGTSGTPSRSGSNASQLSIRSRRGNGNGHISQIPEMASNQNLAPPSLASTSRRNSLTAAIPLSLNTIMETSSDNSNSRPSSATTDSDETLKLERCT